eukprot:SAG22_NODE_813_length_7051_cov_71.816887_2_plen_150_part_00
MSAAAADTPQPAQAGPRSLDDILRAAPSGCFRLGTSATDIKIYQAEHSEDKEGEQQRQPRAATSPAAVPAAAADTPQPAQAGPWSYDVLRALAETYMEWHVALGLEVLDQQRPGSPPTQLARPLRMRCDGAARLGSRILVLAIEELHSN